MPKTWRVSTNPFKPATKQSGSLDLLLLITPPSQGISQAHHTHVQAIAASTFAGFMCCSPSPCSVPKQVFTYNSGQEEWSTCMAVPRQTTHSLGHIHSCTEFANYSLEPTVVHKRCTVALQWFTRGPISIEPTLRDEHPKQTSSVHLLRCS